MTDVEIGEKPATTCGRSHSCLRCSLNHVTVADSSNGGLSTRLNSPPGPFDELSSLRPKPETCELAQALWNFQRTCVGWWAWWGTFGGRITTRTS
jgi:hypothetical protein